jgi:hypothetical protein
LKRYALPDPQDSSHALAQYEQALIQEAISIASSVTTKKYIVLFCVCVCVMCYVLCVCVVCLCLCLRLRLHLPLRLRLHLPLRLRLRFLCLCICIFVNFQNRSEAYNRNILPLCNGIMRAAGFHLAYEAAKVRRD